MEDKTIKCVSGHAKECEKEFLFSVKDQEFYKEKNFTEPKRCKPCREEHKRFLEQGGKQGIKNNHESRSTGPDLPTDRELLDN